MGAAYLLGPEEKHQPHKRGCTGKVSYLSRADAKRAIDNRHTATQLTSYQCRHCDMWHLTSMTTKPTEKSMTQFAEALANAKPKKTVHTNMPLVTRSVVASPPPQQPPPAARIVDADRNEAKLVAMTPELAAVLLEHSDGNRRLRPTYIKWLASEIVRGNWKRTTDAIGIRTDGRVCNAQHRLHAIKLAGEILKEKGKPWPDNILIYVVSNLSDAEFMVLDTGIKRGAADSLNISPQLAADGALIGKTLDRGFLKRVPVDVVQDIVLWWSPVHDMLSKTAVAGSRGSHNAPIRVGAGLQFAIQKNDGDKEYVLAQYLAFLRGDVVGMSKAVANLWKRQAQAGKFYGTTEQRESLALFSYRSFDPKRRDVIPSVSVGTRESVMAEVRAGLLKLEREAGGEPPEKIELTRAIPMSPKRKYTRQAVPAEATV